MLSETLIVPIAPFSKRHDQLPQHPRFRTPATDGCA